ncbi:MAG TPA: maleylpyruvate isomerase family mycothiol-dependent enzyme [Egibacteraceae bacterium]
MPFPELDAFRQECRAIDDTLAAVPADAWSLPGLGEWSVSELVAHMVRGVGRIAAYLDATDGAAAREPVACDRIGYWRFDLVAEAPAVAARARAEAADVDPATWPTRFAEAWRRSADRAEAAGPEAPIRALRGVMRLADYTATRVLEAVVHHMDLRTALGQPPVPTEDAARSVVADLEALLGAPKPRTLGRTRFIRVATGRLPSDDPRFPLLS